MILIFAIILKDFTLAQIYVIVIKNRSSIKFDMTTNAVYFESFAKGLVPCLFSFSKVSICLKSLGKF